jgi:tripartite-type tricarboxylate transporter receptor subunit TctC
MKASRRDVLGASLAVPALVSGTTGARAQEAVYPTRAIALTVSFLAGGSADIASRLLGNRMDPLLGRDGRISIENRGGAGGSIGAEYVRRQPPDGYSLLTATASSHGTNPAALPESTRYDPVADFTAIAMIGSGPLVVMVPGDSPFRDFASLVAAIRARPGELPWATSGAGGIGHLAGEYMGLRLGGLRGEHIPYRGGSAVTEALAKGEVAYSFEVLASTATNLREGRARGLAVTALHRSPLFPEMPTLAELGLDGFDFGTWNVLMGPAGMPRPVVDTLSRAANTALREPVLRERLALAGVDAGAPSTPDSTRAFIVAELEKFRAIVAQAGLRLSRG